MASNATMESDRLPCSPRAAPVIPSAGVPWLSLPLSVRGWGWWGWARRPSICSMPFGMGVMSSSGRSCSPPPWRRASTCAPTCGVEKRGVDVADSSASLLLAPSL
jgi:hypothetical protein